MSYNTPKVINVFYKEDRKPYDINGKAISYFGEDFIGSNDATKIRFYLQPNEPLDGITALIHAKRADGEVRFEILESSSDDLGFFFELTLNAWFTMKVGKVTLSLKIYNGEPTYGLTEGFVTSIESVNGLTIIASDIFTFNVGYAPNATEVVPPFDEGEFNQIITALGHKPDFKETIYVVPMLPTQGELDTGDYDNQWFLVKGPLGKQGKLYHINGSIAEEVELGVEQLNLTPSGNGDVVSGDVIGQVKWNADLGTISFGLYDDVEIGAGDTLFWFVKAKSDEPNIVKGDVVQFAGNVGGEIVVKKAVFDDITAQPDLLMGVAKHDIIAGNKGYIISAGRLNNINTDGFSTSQPILYLSTTTAGLLTSTKPTSGFKGSISAVGRFSTSGNNGFLLVRPNLIKGIGELTDVTLTSVAEGDVLRRQGTQWVNSNTLSTAEANITTLQNDVVALDGRVTTNENDIAQLQVDVVDLDDRLDFVETTGGIDFIKVATFNALPSSGDARLHRLFLTEDTKQLWEFDGTQYNESSPKNLQNITITSDDDNVVAMRVNVDTTQDEDIVSIERDDVKQVWVAKDGKFNVLNEANLYGDLTIAGNLTVNGTTTTVNTTTLDVEDNIITINKNQTGTPETNLLSGIEVERGDETNFQFVFQESSDLFKVGQVGDLQAVATREDTPTNLGVAFFNASTNRFETNTNTKVNASGQLVDLTIRNSGVGERPLTINAVASTTASLQSWQVDGSSLVFIGSNGVLRTTTGMSNSTNTNNAYVSVPTTGTKIERNIADANSALDINLVNSSSTGNITNFQFAGANKLEITRDGFLNQNGTRLFSQPSVDTNTFFGTSSGGTSTTGTLNTGFGRSVLQALTSGSSNTGLGRNALLNVTSGSQNIGIGVNSLNNVVSSSNNMAIGFAAGSTITSGANNTFVGASSGLTGAWGTQLATANNSTAIGNQAYTDASNQMVFGNASVTQFKFDRNSGALVLMPQTRISSATLPPLLAERTTTTFGAFVGSQALQSTTSNDMTDGFGTGTIYYIKDTAGVDNEIGRLALLRSGADNNGRFSFQTATAGTSTEKMTIMPDGKVGIGTSAPATLLALVTASNTDGIQIRRNSATNDDYAGLTFTIANSDTTIKNAEIRGVRTNRAVSGDTDLVFTNRSNGSTTEKMRIRDDGRVGIGTLTPSRVLEIQSFTNTESYLRISGASGNATDTNFAGIEFFNTDESSAGPNVAGFIEARAYDTLGRGADLVFGTTPSTGSEGQRAIERLRILNTGLVGINETTPTAQLQVKSGATTRVPLVVDSLTSHNTNLQEWRINGATAIARIDLFGGGRLPYVGNITSLNNSLIDFLTNGTVISRNIADTNPALIVNLANAGATGNIVNFQKAGTNQAFISGNGYLRSQGVGNITNSDNALLITATTGSTIYRNIADANPALIVNQQSATSTGNIVSFQKAGSNLSTIANNGVFVGQSRPTRTDITANATLALADEGKVLRVNPATPADNITITVPKNSAVAFPIDTEIAILRYNSGTVTIAPVDGDVTINSANGNTKIKDRYSSVALKKIGTNEWVLVGSLEA
jgi:hypothetical protein